MLNARKNLAAVLQPQKVSEGTHRHRWNHYGDMKADEAVWLKQLEDEISRLKVVVGELKLDNRMLNHIADGNW